jgi:hypothetical protein
VATDDIICDRLRRATRSERQRFADCIGETLQHTDADIDVLAGEYRAGAGNWFANRLRRDRTLTYDSILLDHIAHAANEAE